MDPTAFAPRLDVFQHGVNSPSSILIEYLPKLLLMDCVPYSKERIAKAVDGIKQIHLALIEHNDPYPKNIVTVPDDLERVMWIDFDAAITYPDQSYVGDREHGWLELKTECVEELVGAPRKYNVFTATDQVLAADGFTGRRSETGPPTGHGILLGRGFTLSRIQTNPQRKRRNRGLWKRRMAMRELCDLESILAGYATQ